jgi:UDP-glucuronate 4-epimerase
MAGHVLLTGAAGFIGSHLTERLLSEGWRVTGLDNFDPFYDRNIKEANLARALAHPGFQLIEGDIADVDILGHFESHFDCIVHLAAKAGVRPSIADPLGYQRANVAGTQALLEFARKRRIRQFVFASSSSVYGVNPRVPWSEEDAVLLPISPYASTKVSGELLGHVYSHLHGIRFVALRFFTVYGPRQRPDLAIHKFARSLQRGEPIPLFGDGSTRRDYTYVADIVSGVRSAMDYTASDYEVINLSNEMTVTLAELVAMIENTVDRTAEILRLPEQPGDVRQTWGDISKARRLLGYQPATKLADGLARFADWLREEDLAGLGQAVEGEKSEDRLVMDSHG